jgi:hypothetical protein
MMTGTPTRERNEEILKLQADGVKLKKIAQKYGLSVQTVKKIGYVQRRANRELNALKEQYGEWIMGFSNRTRNALMRAGIFNADDLHRAVRDGREVRQIGGNGIEEINQTLDRKIRRVYRRKVAYNEKKKDWVYCGEEPYLEYVEG